MREKKPIDTTTMFIGLTEEGFPMSIAVPKTVNNWNDVVAGDVSFRNFVTIISI